MVWVLVVLSWLQMYALPNTLVSVILFLFILILILSYISTVLLADGESRKRSVGECCACFVSVCLEWCGAHERGEGKERGNERREGFKWDLIGWMGRDGRQAI